MITDNKVRGVETLNRTIRIYNMNNELPPLNDLAPELEESQLDSQATFPNLSKDSLNQLEEPKHHKNLLPR
jgi:hypothetical protein